MFGVVMTQMAEVIVMPVWFFYTSLVIMLVSGVLCTMGVQKLGMMWAQRQREKRIKAKRVTSLSR